jgi:predicted deacylase
LASRLANLFLREIVDGCTHGIDLHTGADDRSNHPSIRADLRDRETHRCALAFGAPVMVQAKLRDGSLRAIAAERGITVLVYEAGQISRYDDWAIQGGVRGVLRVLAALGMRDGASAPARRGVRCDSSHWVRAPRSGLFRAQVKLGERVPARHVLGILSDAFGEREVLVRSPYAGIVIGLQQNPLVTRGDAVAHVAVVARRR